jgi:hypothetical protein
LSLITTNHNHKISNENIHQELKNGIENLKKNIDTFAPDSCQRHVFEVLKDMEVQATFIEALRENYFEKPNCKGGHDQMKVTFHFNCKPPRICFIDPFFVVTYDLSTKKVVDIQKIGF